MSTFGLLALLAFIVTTGVLVALIYGGNTDLPVSRVLMMVLQVLIAGEFVLALYEYPCYVVDGIIFVCMGESMLAWIMLGIFALIIAFVAGMIITRINWGKSLEATPGKLIFCGLLLMVLMAYTELFNGVYSFESYEQFTTVRQRYEQYDDRFLPTKFIRSVDKDGVEHIALYPFDVTTAAGEQPVIYKGDTFMVVHESGAPELFYYPFTYRLYEGAEPVSFSALPKPAPVSPSDVSSGDVSGSDVSAADVSSADTGQ